ncbi:MAG: HAMP domain-containing histidine kinase [Defluviitaleaceae bacterium]|nr:HAMP domain-containing histidine kinase [Defluviitaleaceae bacterium]MCL2261949.1 HAMP domain-containing histidine kinase [Defluviitaleaceae bacterium]
MPWIRRGELERLSADIRRIIDGQAPDLRDNLEGQLSILKNDIHTLAGKLKEESANLAREKAAMADTLADISHQLKTPLTAMMVMADLLETAPPERAAGFIHNLKKGLVQTGWLANALLKMAKLESGSVVFSPGEITAGALADAALQPLQILLDIKGQRVEWQSGSAPTSKDAPWETRLYCDKNWTAEALTNIIKNASEHSPENSVITLSAGENPLCRWVSVADAGAGIPQEMMRGLFQRFGGGRDGDKQGHGIGLPLAMAILRGQNGDISVENRNGAGAVFMLKFY